MAAVATHQGRLGVNTSMSPTFTQFPSFPDPEPELKVSTAVVTNTTLPITPPSSPTQNTASPVRSIRWVPETVTWTIDQVTSAFRKRQDSNTPAASPTSTTDEPEPEAKAGVKAEAKAEKVEEHPPKAGWMEEVASTFQEANGWSSFPDPVFFEPFADVVVTVQDKGSAAGALTKVANKKK